MKNFIKALYVDLINRIDVVINDIKCREFHQDIKDRFVYVTLNQLATLKNELNTSLKNGELEFDILASNNLFRFNKAHRDFKSIHSYRYLALINYKEPEIFLNKIINKIYKEHRIFSLPPIVSTISNQDDYYWAHTFFELIALPIGEEKSLLNLPDMYHEIGHFLTIMFQGKSSEISSALIDKYFNEEIVRVIDEGIAEKYKPLLEKVKYLWQSSWLEEFSSDLVGTYMTGAAYAWTNLKLLTTGHGSAKIYEYYPTHPSNEARMRIIILMLGKLGLSDDCKEVRHTWQAFLKDTEAFKPIDYPMIFPEKLLKYLVEEFYEFYQNADLASYADLKNSSHKSIAGLLNEAWNQAKNNSSNYSEYEMKEIDALKKKFWLL